MLHRNKTRRRRSFRAAPLIFHKGGGPAEGIITTEDGINITTEDGVNIEEEG